MEGGQWLWPPGEVGHAHLLPDLTAPGVTTRVVTLSLKPLVVEVENFLSPDEAKHIWTRAAPAAGGNGRRPRVTTHHQLLAWCLLGLSPLLRTPECGLSSLEACSGPPKLAAALRSSPKPAPRLRWLPVPFAGAAHGEVGRGAEGCGQGQGAPLTTPPPSSPAQRNPPTSAPWHSTQHVQPHGSPLSSVSRRRRRSSARRRSTSCPPPTTRFSRGWTSACSSWFQVPSTCSRTAPHRASFGHLKAQAAPMHPRAQPEPLGSSPWPPQPASGRPEV